MRHNIDMMHIEKHVCENSLFTLLNDSSKSKDHINALRDLQVMGLRLDLWYKENEKKNLSNSLYFD